MRDIAPLPTVLIFGGDARERAAMAQALSDGFECLTAATGEELQRQMSDNFVQVAIAAGTDAEMARSLSRWPETICITQAEDGSTESPHTLPRDWSSRQLATAVATAREVFQLKRENERLALEMRCLKIQKPRTQASRTSLGFEAILRAPGSPMARLVATARQYASFDVPVLLTGETGTGKAEIARAIHDSSLRSDQPFLALDVTGLSEDAIALALFGQRKPANGTQAINRTGLVRKADHGTLFLSGIDTLSHQMQLQLLRLARDGQFEPVGAAEPETTRTRLVTATCADPAHLIAQGRLDPALYYAISIAELTLPPLKSRKCDIPLLARAVIEEASRAHGKIAHGFDAAALDFLMAYDWPGNLSELSNEVTRMLIQAQDTVLGPEVISRRILQASPAQIDKTDAEIMRATGPLKDRLEAIEARILRETLTRLKWNKSRSAAELGLSRVGLRAKLDRYGITKPQTEEV